jgi:hypothetical protein
MLLEVGDNYTMRAVPITIFNEYYQGNSGRRRLTGDVQIIGETGRVTIRK